MNKSFKVSGMTCQGCVASVRDGLLQLEEVNEVSIDLASGEVEMELNKNANLDVLQKAIPQKYQIVDESLSIEAEIDQKLDDLIEESAELEDEEDETPKEPKGTALVTEKEAKKRKEKERKLWC